MPLYVADYDADTAHLTLAEDGAYSRLLRLSWRTPGCTMPEDDDWIMRRMRVDREEFDRLIKPIISEFFSVKKGRVFSARLQHEFERINATSKMRSIAGKKGGHPRKAQKANGKDLSPAKTKRKQLEPEPEPNPKLRKKDTKVSKKKRATTLPETATISQYQLAKAVELGHSPEEAEAQFRKFKDHCLANGRTYVDWNAAWRNWLNSPLFKPIINPLKAFDGGQHGLQTDSSQRLQRIVQAAATGTSGKDWG